MEQTMKSLRYFSMLLPLFTATAVHAAAAIQSEPIQPIPKAVVKNPAMVELGKKLFLNRACPNPVLFLVIPVTTCPPAAVTISVRRLATIGSKGLSVRLRCSIPA
jgi:hypothetical protein